MMKQKLMLKNLVISFLAIFLFAFNSGHQWKPEPRAGSYYNNKIKMMQWLLGNWENVDAEGALYESWIKESDSVFTGHSCFIKGKDTLSSESISLEQKGDDLFYIPTVKGQNNDQPVSFRLTTMEGNKFVFENPAHDFPQTIIYEKLSDNSLLAEIAGMLNGEKHSEKFAMTRTKK